MVNLDMLLQHIKGELLGLNIVHWHISLMSSFPHSEFLREAHSWCDQLIVHCQQAIGCIPDKRVLEVFIVYDAMVRAGVHWEGRIPAHSIIMSFMPIFWHSVTAINKQITPIKRYQDCHAQLENWAIYFVQCSPKQLEICFFRFSICEVFLRTRNFLGLETSL